MKGLQSLLFSSVLVVCLAVNSNADLVPRQTSTGISTGTSASATATPPVTSTESTSTTTTTTSATSSTTDKPDTKPDTTTSSSSVLSITTGTTSSDSTSATPTNAAPAPVTSTTATPSVFVTTVGGNEITITSTQSQTSTSSTSSSTSTQSAGADTSNNDSSGLGTGSIVGLAVAGGVAVIGIIAFFVWKFTRKRFSDFDDNEAIKWPDLNTHGAGGADSHPVPVHNTGRSGFDTGSDGSLSRVPSTNYSTPDLGPGGPDPYAVPPLPHLNPNQPYRDDPAAAGAYYDPYHGPVPGTLDHGATGQDWGGEVIPMTQLGGRMSPGPHAAYGAEPLYNQSQQHYDPNAGRMSPGPHAAYGAEPPYDHNAGRQSPGPNAAYAGRTSPGPQAGLGGRMSPGPHAAYGASSPQPPAAGGYDAYGGRR